MMNGSVGIFWGILSPHDSWTILLDATPLAEAEAYGDFLTHPRGHYEVWEQWKKPRQAPAASRSIAQAIVDNEYETFPRGRILYHTGTRRFILYADRRLQIGLTIQAIAASFQAHSTFALTSTTAPRCDACLRSLIHMSGIAPKADQRQALLLVCKGPLTDP